MKVQTLVTSQIVKERIPGLNAWMLQIRVRSNISNTKTGGADRDRTGDPRVANAVLSQLSYSPELFRCRWWVWEDSNHRPRPYQGRALTT